MAKSPNPPCETLLEIQRQCATPPVATVVIPLYNYGQFIVEGLESVCAQTLENFDLIIVDDHSTDNSADIARDWLGAHAARFRRVCLLRQARNAGLAATRNAGFHQAATPFVLPLDADNAIYPTCLEKLHRSLLSSEAAFAYCLVERFGAKPAEPLMHLRPWNPSTLARDNWIDAMVLLRRRIWEQVGGYSENMPHPGWEDYDLWFKIARAGGYGLQVFQILARYRVHPASMLHTVTNRKENEQTLRAYFRSAYAEFFDAPLA